MEGQTDANGNLKCVVAAAIAETSTMQNDGNPIEDENGHTDTNGNLVCKAYA